MNDLVSVIIPVFNVEQYLDACLESVVKQSYDNLEIIVVNDGSTDNSGKKCDDWSQKDERIHVIHQQNQGLSGARNTALEMFKGDWITFVDSDDMIHPDYIKILLSMVTEYGVSIAQCDHTKAGGNQEEEERSVTRIMESGKFLLSKYYYTTAWGKIYSRDIFLETRFPYGKIHEDLALMYRLVYEAGRVAYTEQALYFHHRRPDSINAAGRFYREKLVTLQFLKERIEYFEQKEETTLVEYSISAYGLELLNCYVKTKKYLKDRELAKEIKGEYRRHYKRMKKISVISGRAKVLFYICYFLPETWKLLMERKK